MSEGWPDAPTGILIDPATEDVRSGRPLLVPAVGAPVAANPSADRPYPGRTEVVIQRGNSLG